MPPKRKAATRSAPKRRSKKEEESSEEEDVLDEEISEEESGQDDVEEKAPKKSRRVADKEALEKATEKANNAPADKLGLVWESENSTLLVLDSKQSKPSDKVIGFDMDGTLINPKSGAKFPKNRNDWEWLYDGVPEKLRELNKDGFKVVIFTNQAGIEKNKQSPGDLKGKIIDLSVELEFPLQAFIAAATDLNRKPNTTMWDIFCEKHNGGVKIDMEKSMFVGDAAGRAKEWRKGAKKDFSCSDRSFAHNIGITFKTPEEFFLGEDAAKFEFDSLDPVQYLKDLEQSGVAEPKAENIVGGVEGAEMVLMVGRPASGKSSFAKKFFVSKGYVHANQDTLKTKEKCLKVLKESLSEGKSVIVDNTCPSREARAYYIRAAKDAGVPFRCFWFDTDVQLAHHLNFFREKVTGGAVRRIPDVAYNQFKSKFQEPTTDEGFSKVVKVHWYPDFKDDAMKKMFSQRT